MKLSGLIKQTLVDYPGEIAAVVFTQGCNLRCPFCHNGHLVTKPGKIAEEYIPEQVLLDFLAERKGFIDALVISGGEPTLHPDLPELVQKVKKLGYLIKLDTNGTNSSMLEMLLKNNLLDYIAMDIKAPLDLKSYQLACGNLSTEDFFQVRNSINLLQNSKIDVEFRTTVVPSIHSAEDIENIAKYIEGAKLYSLQQFNPQVTLQVSYESVPPYDKETMQAIADRCAPYVQKVRVVNL
ncbi:MAG TPA: anaerobic ribonucleoside-triphosphate reductase activating protein [Syntrophomonadaceae bacterium]|nr:anaerobic ribonucleoside-triphosphate reductase activating protein [Syntrophomonadaceae bacterium]